MLGISLQVYYLLLLSWLLSLYLIDNMYLITSWLFIIIVMIMILAVGWYYASHYKLIIYYHHQDYESRILMDNIYLIKIRLFMISIINNEIISIIIMIIMLVFDGQYVSHYKLIIYYYHPDYYARIWSIIYTSLQVHYLLVSSWLLSLNRKDNIMYLITS